MTNQGGFLEPSIIYKGKKVASEMVDVNFEIFG
jgi:hypothetical protein